MAGSGLRATVALANGVELPRVGLGTFKVRGDEAYAAVAAALRCGIRHIDTASIYKNSEEVGRAVRDSGVPRAESFITSKISPYEQGTERARAACEAQLAALDLDYIDLMLIHWPGVSKMQGDNPMVRDLRLETWRVLEEYHRLGKFRSIGVSNFEVHHLSHLLDEATTPPMVNQIEVHPNFQQVDLRAFCASAGIEVVAYSSLGAGSLLEDQRVLAVACREKISAAQALLLWGLQRNCCVIPKSVRPERIADFSPDRSLRLHLDAASMAELDAMGDGVKCCWDPSSVVV